ncbi:AraC family transcriptional regulator [Pseudomonas rhizoryzae]|uniref:AraC family transcriptional regulator n=1 Tax=Pseudomonas rhizoryzae TaxID=2571129 RepID=UPI000736AD7A|nr:AraC family transcriptional regulator [Pseudomonas rhizoryzae]KTT31412.1 AraC family transcriptional regulator [Pseudomonas psychrotolerans]KTT74463.1 AraC family transcriptional regulator [Pseudomonas psychrotolerans]
MPDPVDPRFSRASAPPQVSRLLLRVAADRQGDVERLCRGLGFTPADVQRPGFRLSHRQGYLLVRRCLAQLGDDGLGLAVGARQTTVSLGLVGLGMQACATLGAALALGLHYQRQAGAMLDYGLEQEAKSVRLLLTPRFHEPAVTAFYMEEGLASVVSIARHLTGTALLPQALCLDYPAPPHGERYAALFQCPVRFTAAVTAIEFDAAWLALPLATRDDAVAAEVVELLEATAGFDPLRTDLVEGLQRELCKRLDTPPTLAQLAAPLNLSERTLRRRLEAVGTSYQALLDEARRGLALALLGREDLALTEVAFQTGFGDLRNFRRAFKRWTGVTPQEARRRLRTRLNEED